MTNGARLYLGGSESAKEVCAPLRLRSGNVAGIGHLCDCRGNNRIDRWNKCHVLRPGAEVSYQQLQINRLACTQDNGATLKFADEFLQEFRPTLTALEEGKQVLVFCINGRNRSAATILALYAACIALDTHYLRSQSVGDAVDLAVADLRRLRAICEFDAHWDGKHAGPQTLATVFSLTKDELWRGLIGFLLLCLMCRVRSAAPLLPPNALPQLPPSLFRQVPSISSLPPGAPTCPPAAPFHSAFSISHFAWSNVAFYILYLACCTSHPAFAFCFVHCCIIYLPLCKYAFRCTKIHFAIYV